MFIGDWAHAQPATPHAPARPGDAASGPAPSATSPVEWHGVNVDLIRGPYAVHGVNYVGLVFLVSVAATCWKGTSLSSDSLPHNTRGMATYSKERVTFGAAWC